MTVRLALNAMATRFEILIEGDEEPQLRAAGEAALAEIEECERQLSCFRRESLLGHLARAEIGTEVRLDADTFELFRLCADVRRRSGGAFDIDVGHLMRARGFRGEPSGAASSPTQPASTEAYALDDGARSIRLLRRDVSLDLGAVAKGFALDLAAATLRQSGICRALLHGGTSTVVAIGAPAGSTGWIVAVEGGVAAPLVTLRDSALSVSASHGRVNVEGAGHVLDPRTGVSARPDGLAATLAPTGMLADAWSTALLVTFDPRILPSGLSGFLGVGERGRRTWSDLPKGVVHSAFPPEPVHDPEPS